MERFSADLRWILLNKLVDFPHLDRVYQFFLLLFSFIAIYLIIYPFLPAKFLPQKSIYLINIIQSDIFYTLIISALIISGRWPGLLIGYQNPDETFLLTGATKLLQDPIFWRSVDTTTSGPLNVYPLMIPSLFGFRLEYASARVIGLGLMIVSVTCLYYSLRCIYSETTARLATFVVAITIALMRFAQYIHYSSEHMPIALLSIAILFCCQIYICQTPQRQNYLIFSLGFVLGMSPFSKYQSIPIAFSIFIVSLHIIWVKSTSINQFFRHIFILIAGSLSFPIFIFLYLIFFDLIDDFWKMSIQTNLLFYVQEASKLKNYSSDWSSKIAIFSQILKTSSETYIIFSLTGITVLLTSIIFFFKKSLINPFIKSANTSLFIYYSLLFLIASTYSVVKPGNPFLHYLLFLIIPCGFSLGVFIGEIENQLSIFTKRRKKWFMTIIFAIIIILCLRDVFDSRGNRFISKRKEFLENYINPPAQFIVNHSQIGESIAVWGDYPSNVYIQTGLTPALRDIDNIWQIVSHPLQEFYLERYKNDLLKSQPSFFVDTMPEKSTDILKKSHDHFPLIADFIEKNYELLEEINGFRIYVRSEKK